MYVIVKHQGEFVGSVMTNRSLTTEEACNLVGIDFTETDGGDPRWDYNAVEIETLTDEEFAESEYAN